jgi:hypothetical protein
MTKPAVQYGINVNTRVPVIYADRYSAAGVIRLGERVEQLGYDAVWVGDNFFAKGRMESVTSLAAIASRTSRVALGTSAFLPGWRRSETSARITPPAAWPGLEGRCLAQEVLPW